MQVLTRSGIPGARRGRAGRRLRAILSGCLGLVAVAALAGCAQQSSAAASIQLGTAYLTKPSAQGSTSAYVTIQNNGAADRLTAVKTSAGGVVTFYGPDRPGDTAMRVLRDIAVPARATLRLIPDGPHLLITHAGRMRSGTEITLTLTFARAGPLSVSAVVNDPENTGGSTFFVN